MDLFDLQAKITLDSSEYEKQIQNASRTAQDFAEDFNQVSSATDQAAGSLDALAEGVLQGITEGLQEAAAAGQDVSQIQAALDEAAEGFVNGSESAEEFLGKIREIASEAEVAVDPLEELGDSAEEAGKGHEDAGESASVFASMLKSNLYSQAITKGIDMLKRLVSETAAYGDAVDKSSQKLGISSSAYQKWDAVLRHSGTSMDSMSFTFKTLANAAQDASDDQVAAFERIGLSMEEVSNMATEDLFGAVIQGLQNMEQGTERTAIATDLLGRGAMELGPLLNTSAEETQKMLNRVQDLGGVMSDDGVKASAAFKDAWQDFTTILEGKTRDAASVVLPILTDIIEYANESAVFVANIGRVDTTGYDTVSEKLIALKRNVKDVNDEAKDLAMSGAYEQMTTANTAIANSYEQLQEAMSDPETMRKFFEEVGAGMVSTADYAEIMGVSNAEAAQSIRYYMTQASAASNAAVSGAEDAADAYDDQAEAERLAAERAQEAHDALIGIASESIDLRYTNKDLRKEYDRLVREFEAVKDSGDDTAVMLAEQKLQALNLAATNQELARGYPAIVSRLDGFGVTLTQTSAWLDANGMSAQDWGNQVNSATNNVINGFQELDTSLDMSLEDMAANMQSNIEAYASWNQNIADMMEAAKASGNDAAVAFVQYMADMGIGAADQVALMAQDIDGTFATFAPMMGDAIDQGMWQVWNSIEGANTGDAMQGNMDDIVGIVEDTDLSSSGGQLMTGLASGESANAYMVSNAAQTAVSGAKTAADGETGAMYWVGWDMDQGIISGIDAGAYLIEKAAKEAARRAYKAALAELGASSSKDGLQQRFISPETSATAIGGNTVNNYFTVSGAENPESYASRLARQIQMQMRMV